MDHFEDELFAIGGPAGGDPARFTALKADIAALFDRQLAARPGGALRVTSDV